MTKSKLSTLVSNSVYTHLKTLTKDVDKSYIPAIDAVSQGIADALVRYSKDTSPGLAESTAYNILERASEK